MARFVIDVAGASMPVNRYGRWFAVAMAPPLQGDACHADAAH